MFTKLNIFAIALKEIPYEIQCTRENYFYQAWKKPSKELNAHLLKMVNFIFIYR